MAKKPESKFSKKFTEANKKVFWTRVESWALPGVPDLHGCYGAVTFWVEAKVVDLPKVKFGLTANQMTLRPHQIQWQMQYARHGGRVYNLVHRPSSSIVQLYDAASLAEGPWSPIMEADDDVGGLRMIGEYIIELGR
jgi:hypothetical protein